jgi:acetolactate synthase-1/2/3 large subunit
MAQMTGGEALVAGLKDHRIDTVFGLPGAQTYGLFDALHRAQPGIRTIGARHEQACAYMAFGYARSTGRPSVFSVVPGPGMLNASAGLLTALGCNEPVLLLTGQLPTDFLGKGRGHLHEMPDQLATMRGFVKWAERVSSPAQARSGVARAFQQMLSGRPGPAALEMPWDIFTQQGGAGEGIQLPLLPPPLVNEDDIREAAKLIGTSKHPMIFVGAGAFGAAEAILALAEEIDAPVVGFRSGRGIVSNDHELGLTIAAAYNLWPQTDLMIGIGTRLEAPSWRWSWRPPGLKTIRIDIDPLEMQRLVPDVAIVGDAAPATASLVEAIRANGYRREKGRRQIITEASRLAETQIQVVQPQMAYLNVLRQVLPRDAFVTDELSQVGFASWYGFPVYEPRTYVTSGYMGTLGSGFPTALGVKVAHPGKAVVAITGDGGFMFAAPELATAAQYGIDVITLVFNNNAFGNVRRDQREQFGGRTIVADLRNPDFVKFTESFGLRAASVNTPADFRHELERALAEGGPQVIEIRTEAETEVSPWRFIHPPPPEGQS